MGVIVREVVSGHAKVCWLYVFQGMQKHSKACCQVKAKAKAKASSFLSTNI